MSMTEEEKSKCAVIIHTHAAAAGAGNLIPIPGTGYAADMVTMATMAMALSAVFGDSIEKNVAQNMAIVALKKELLKAPIKALTKEVTKFIPFAGQLIAPAISISMLEAAGWCLAEELSNKRK